MKGFREVLRIEGLDGRAKIYVGFENPKLFFKKN
jgi:hypothetical protein